MALPVLKAALSQAHLIPGDASHVFGLSPEWCLPTDWTHCRAPDSLLFLLARTRALIAAESRGHARTTLPSSLSADSNGKPDAKSLGGVFVTASLPIGGDFCGPVFKPIAVSMVASVLSMQVTTLRSSRSSRANLRYMTAPGYVPRPGLPSWPSMFGSG